MRRIEYWIPNPCTLFGVSDAHPKSIGFQRIPFEDYIGLIASNKTRNRALALGDMNDAINPKDKRHSITEINPEIPTFEAERRYIKNQLRRLAIDEKTSQLLVYLAGNHEETISKEQGDVAESIAEDLGIPYGGRMCIIDLYQENPDDKENPFHLRILAMHGAGSIASNDPDPFERQHKIRRALRKKFSMLKINADFFICGHYHKYIDIRPIRDLKLEYVEDDLKPHYEWEGSPMLALPSFLAAYSDGETTYEEAQARTLNDIGGAFINIEDGVITEMDGVFYI